MTISLRGFGVDLIASRVQESIEGFYELERVADVSDYIVQAEREQLLVRHTDDGLELRLELPPDDLVQIIEGVSHFVYVATRASQDRAATALEMEMQAEVDKWLLLAGDFESLDVARSAALRAKLFEKVGYAHEEGSELGERYRVANRTALRFVRRLERTHVAERRFAELRRELRDFFRGGQEEKLRLAQ